jgi:biopolymer transport protein ExbD
MKILYSLLIFIGGIATGAVLTAWLHNPVEEPDRGTPVAASFFQTGSHSIIEILITDSGTYYNRTLIEHEDLVSSLNRLFEKAPEQEILIRSDIDIPISGFTDVYSRIKDIGFKQIAIYFSDFSSEDVPISFKQPTYGFIPYRLLYDPDKMENE